MASAPFLHERHGWDFEGKNREAAGPPRLIIKINLFRGMLGEAQAGSTTKSQQRASTPTPLAAEMFCISCNFHHRAEEKQSGRATFCRRNEAEKSTFINFISWVWQPPGWALKHYHHPLSINSTHLFGQAARLVRAGRAGDAALRSMLHSSLQGGMAR